MRAVARKNPTARKKTTFFLALSNLTKDASCVESIGSRCILYVIESFLAREIKSERKKYQIKLKKERKKQQRQSRHLTI